jgi:protein regulator of cytokinesis 1
LNQRETILQQKREFDSSSADPDRLLSKKRDPGRLLREEKFRKVVAKELPKIESKLKTSIDDWQTTYQQPFIWEGRYYLDELPSSEKKGPASSKVLNL